MPIDAPIDLRRLANVVEKIDGVAHEAVVLLRVSFPGETVSKWSNTFSVLAAVDVLLLAEHRGLDALELRQHRRHGRAGISAGCW